MDRIKNIPNRCLWRMRWLEDSSVWYRIKERRVTPRARQQMLILMSNWAAEELCLTVEYVILSPQKGWRHCRSCISPMNRASNWPKTSKRQRLVVRSWECSIWRSSWASPRARPCRSSTHLASLSILSLHLLQRSHGNRDPSQTCLLRYRRQRSTRLTQAGATEATRARAVKTPHKKFPKIKSWRLQTQGHSKFKAWATGTWRNSPSICSRTIRSSIKPWMGAPLHGQERWVGSMGLRPSILLKNLEIIC